MDLATTATRVIESRSRGIIVVVRFAFSLCVLLPACPRRVARGHKHFMGRDDELVERHEVARTPKFIEAGVPLATETLFALTLPS